MNRLYGTVVSLSLIAGGFMCAAQDSTIPFKQIQREASLFAGLSISGREAVLNHPAEDAFSMPSPLPGAGYLQPKYERPRIVDRKFLLLNGLHMGLAALDYGLTQHCIAAQHCREGNPLMPSSVAGQIAVGSAWVGSGFYISYHLKKQDSKLWWLSPVAGISAHAAGAVTGFMNR